MPKPTDLFTTLTFDRLATALFFIVVATVACLMPIQNDTWWQLRAGQEFWQTGSVPLEETYSHTANGRFWMNHEWLSEAIFYAVYRAGGLPLLIMLAVVAATVSVGITWSLMRGPTLIRLALAGLTLGVTSIAWTPRPHVFTLLLVAVTTAGLVARRQWWLPVVFLVWANLHGGFTLGVGLLGAFWLAGISYGWTTIATRSVLVTACLLMTLATPLGISFWLELPASLSRLQAYEVQEWRGPALTDVSLLPFWCVLGGLVYFVYQRGRTLFADPADRLLTIASLLFVPLALTSLRNVPPFLVLSLPVVSRALRASMPPPVPRLSTAQARVHVGILACAGVIAVTVVAIAWTIPLARLGWNPVSEAATAAIADCEGPLYNSYDDGGYVVWFLPERKVFLDSRQDPYPVELIQQDLRAQFEGRYREMFEQHGIRCAFVRSGVPLDRRLQADGWLVRFRDEQWTVLGAAN